MLHYFSSEEPELCMCPARLEDSETPGAQFRLENQAVMIGAGVRTSAESWELNVCVWPLSCMWQVNGGHLHETHA